MWLINAITPDHGTIAGFVKNNRKAFHVTLRNLTLILKGWGLIDGKLIAIDGTKIRAQNSKHNCITKSGLDKKIAYADEQINAYLMALAKRLALVAVANIKINVPHPKAEERFKDGSMKLY